MVEPKKGEVWINRGFWSIYKRSRFVAYVRIIDVTDKGVTLKSIADNNDGRFNPNSGTFVIEREQWNKDQQGYAESPKWTKATPEEIKYFTQCRYTHQVLYGHGRSDWTT